MQIRKVAILGAGTMGSQIAAHFTNASIPSLLFDLPGLSAQGLEKLKKMDPAPLFDPSLISLIEPLEFGKDFEKLKGVDWILEAIVEDLASKRQLLQSVLPYVPANAIVSSNTSGIPLSMIAAELPGDFRQRWLGTHFFNPPRYLKLLELIPTKETKQNLADAVAGFADRKLGKGVIFAKDTPNFIANRLATFGGLYTLQTMLEEGLTIEEVDSITGPLLGRPKTATFRLLDLVGIDVLSLVAQNLYANTVDDEQREIFKVPPLLQSLLNKKWLGNKTGQGFYKKQGSEILVYDPVAQNYRAHTKPGLPSLDAVRVIEDPLERISALIRSKDAAGRFVWKTLSAFLCYAANRIPEISDDILNIDRSMKWGFGWSHGPFEIWDAIGLRDSVERMRKEGKRLPEWLNRLLEQEPASFYRWKNGEKKLWNPLEARYELVPEPDCMISLHNWKREHGVIKRNAGASLIDLGEGVACLEFHSKMNAIGADTIQMVKSAIDIVEKDYAGLLIANQGENFSVGANLMLILLEAQEGNWEDIDLIVRAFQQMAMSLKYSSKPVVAAPFGLALGGGCEISMGADAIHSAAEVYTGLVEIGVGLIPAGGGCKEMLLRHFAKMVPGGDPLPHLRNVFETIALAKVSRSAMDAKKIGYFSSSDTFSMNSDRLINDAKDIVLQLSHDYRIPHPRKNIVMTGAPGYAYLRMGIFLMHEAGRISEYEKRIGEKIAWVLTGGDFTEPTEVDEQFVLDLEREAFLSLLGERKTQERIQHMLKTGKPLRN